jgi:ABC-type branched-subunit amino acid transport system ATPase component
VLLIEHDIDRVFEFADSITVMADGAVLVEGSADEVQGNARVQEVYLGSGRAVVAARAAHAQPDALRAALLTLEGVNTYYGKSHILYDVSLEVRAGEVTALLGRNGAGKSSTVKTIMGLAPPANGTVRFAGEVVSGRAPEHIARAGVGLVPQGRRLFSGLTVAENLAIGAASLGRRRGEAEEERERLLELFPVLAQRLDSPAATLSGGEQQQLAIARSLMSRPRLLLLDEPTLGLAPKLVRLVFELIGRLRDEQEVLSRRTGTAETLQRYDDLEEAVGRAHKKSIRNTALIWFTLSGVSLAVWFKVT